MTEKARKYRSDKRRAIDLIKNFIAGTNDFNLYENDLKTQSAVERQLATELSHVPSNFVQLLNFGFVFV